MTETPQGVVELSGVHKHYGVPQPLHIRRLVVQERDRLALIGFDAGAAESFVHLVTGASLPDEGDVRVAGRDTRAIATDTEWLASLDRFGLVTERAVLIDKISIAANLALPLTLAIEPMAPETRREVEGLAADAGLPSARLDEPTSTLNGLERIRVHLARAMANKPSMLILEHPTARLEHPDQSRALGETLCAAADARGFGWIALTADEAFARASGARLLKLQAATGELTPLAPPGFWERVFGPLNSRRSRA
jgi:predicted ABC-type transport system involved in lysophospholipase L1 biosynthesis ATPase subunit